MKSSLAATLAGVAFLVLQLTGSIHAAEPGGLGKETAEQRDARLQWWREARFGMFIHWGPVSLKGTEIGWSRGEQVPTEIYDNLYKEFNPTQFNADEWASLAKTAGMKYLVLTSKHHDGFCIWDTKQTDFNVMKSPFGRDVCKELSEACKRQGIRFCTYHSVTDWHHPAHPYGSPGGKTRKSTADIEAYTIYIRNQVRELITNYGPLGIMWFDVPQGFDRARGQALNDYVYSLQPDIIINDRSGAPGDYDTPEQRVGGFQMGRPWETCMTICRQWAWKPNDDMKSLKQCLQTLIFCAGGDGNLLFNVGPMPTGQIEPRQVERLKEMGAWLGKYGQSIYGTRGGPFKPTSWLASTRQGNTIYVHVLAWRGEVVTLPPMAGKIVKSELLTGGRVEVKQTEQGITILVPPQDRQEIDTIVKLELDRPAMSMEPIGLASASLAAGKKAVASNVFQKNRQFGPEQALDDDDATRWATDAGTQQAWLEVDLGTAVAVGAVKIDEAYAGRVEKFELQYKEGEQWKTIFAGTRLGEDFQRKFPPVTARQVRLNILQASDGPTINEFQLFKPE
jgi:alpha-L-fucosidase